NFSIRVVIINIAKHMGDNGLFLEQYVAQFAIFMVEKRKAKALIAIGARNTVVNRRYMTNIPSIIKNIVKPLTQILELRSIVKPKGSNGIINSCRNMFVILISWLAKKSRSGRVNIQTAIFE
ncbi:hypothetical protein ACEV7P_24915, partial [Vibrio parahaemolyticus]